MHTILTNPTPQELIAATETNYIAYFAGFACLPRCTFSQNTEFTWFIAGDLPGNTVLHTHLDPSNAHRRISEHLQVLTSTEQARSGWWQVLPTCQPPHLAQFLLANGLTKIEGRPVMILDLRTLPAEVALPDDVRIERVRDEHMLGDWLAASAAGFEASVAQVQIYYDAYACLGFNENSMFHHYVGYLGEQPVTSSTLHLAGGLAGLYDVSTAPQARKQGLGRAISLTALLDARNRGYRYAVLQSSKEGYKVYQKLGFADLYHEDNYLWGNQTQ